MIISDVLLFVRVAETLCFKAAAEYLNISRSQVSKRIAALEDELGTRLIYRSPRSISLTSAGETLLRYYRQVFETMEEAKFALEHLNTTCAGRLRFSLPTCLAGALLPRIHSEFLPRHPSLVLHGHVSEGCVDIVSGGFDLAICVAQRLSDSTLTARRLATSPLVLAAAPTYLARHGIPTHPSQLERHRCLALQHAKQNGSAWQFQFAGERLYAPVHVVLVSDTHLTLVPAACAGLGFIYLPMVSIAAELRQGKLQSVLPDFCAGLDWGIHALHASRTPTRNAAALMEFVRETLAGFDGVRTAAPAVPTALVPGKPAARGEWPLLAGNQDKSAGFQSAGKALSGT
jgi:DNA-binding transcriptional LysR family regulator